MPGETEKYRLSVYQTMEIIKKGNDCLIEKVYCTLDEKTYIKRTYPDDKREVFLTLQKINSRHIPHIHEVFFDDGTVIIETYIPGKPLGEMLETAAVTKKQAGCFARQLLEALGALHSQGLIHRDVKPDNILVGDDAILHLIDYGIARLYRANADKDTQLLGTIGYAPPEQFGFSQTDFRTDVYAAGVTIEEICANAKCPSGSAAARVARKCREIDPNRRYGSASDAQRDMRLKQLKTKGILAAALLLVVVSVSIAVISRLAASPSASGRNMGSSALDGGHVDDPAADSRSTGAPAPSGGHVGGPDTDNQRKDDSAPDGGQGTQPMGNGYENHYQDESGVKWVDIIDIYSDEETIYLPISAAAGPETAEIALADGLPEIDLLYEVKNGALYLTLSDRVLPGQDFVFSYETDYPPDYADTSVEAEIIFYDMDGDGQYEMLIALSDRERFEGVNGYVLSNTNWYAVWCVGYAPGEGFWQAGGMMDTPGFIPIMLNYFGDRELYDYDSVLRLIGRDLRQVN